MRALVPALLALWLLAGCVVCDRATAADGRYQVTSDCSGQVVSGILTIGGSLALISAPCDAAEDADAGAHLATTPGDAGSAQEAATSAVGCGAGASSGSSCPETVASGADVLGLPSSVKVNGPGDFELSGDIGGRSLDCTPESFGDEQVLFCREGGEVVCAAAVAVH